MPGGKKSRCTGIRRATPDTDISPYKGQASHWILKMDSEKGFEGPDMQIWGIKKTNCAVSWPTTVCIQSITVTSQSTPKEEPTQKPVLLEYSIAASISLIHVYLINNVNVQTNSERVSSLTLYLFLKWIIFSPKFIEPILLEGEKTKGCSFNVPLNFVEI